MCGICGIKGLISEERSRCVDDMLETLYHRGPDEKGRYNDDGISLGIRRLSIIDLKTGSQPICNEKKNLQVICNGEIYNFLTLRDDLLKKGHYFYTNSDTEVLVHLYEEHGTDCLKFIKGMFSFAMWDKDKKILFMARDRFGIKPLYYYCKNGNFAFSSELKALLRLPFISRELDMEALNLYLSLEYVPSPYSIWKGISKLKPAHYIIYKDNNLEIKRYWDLEGSHVGNNLTFSDARDRFRELLDDSIREHLVSDVPLGVFLSGGIDSSTLVALIRNISNKKISTFSIGFNETSFDESGDALLVSRHFGTEHHNYTFGIDDFIDSLSNLVYSLDEPLADLSIFPTYMLSRLSRRHIKVALSGEGADELLMGYPTYRAHKYISLFNRYLYNLKGIARHAIDRLPTSFEYFSLDFKLKQLARGMGESDPIIRHALWMTAFSDSDKDAFFSEGFKKENVSYRMSGVNFMNKLIKNMNIKDAYKRIQYLDIFSYLSEDLLVKSDRASMSSSLEARVPYLDHKLVEFIWGLDNKFIYQKRVFKEAVRAFMPPQILSRPKKGFPIPFSKWLREERFFTIVEEFFERGFVEKQGLFNHAYISSLLKRHLTGREDNRKRLRTYIMFQAWFKRWYK